MKISPDDVLGALGTRVGDGDHLVAAAVEDYKKLRSKVRIRFRADRNRVHYAEAGCYLKALIHDQIYRLYGGED